jgi:hypothetical protein
MNNLVSLTPYVREREASSRGDLGYMIMALFKGQRRFDKFLIELGRDGIITFRHLLEITEDELFERHPLPRNRRREFVATINEVGFSFKQMRPTAHYRYPTPFSIGKRKP